MKKNLFIVFDGLDGSGKDTQIFEFAKYLRNSNKYSPLWITREPTKLTNEGIKICDKLLTKSISKDNAVNLYIKDRIKHSKIIRKMLKQNIVLSSRYDFSTLLYQYSQGYDLDKLFEKHKYNKLNGTLIPDITFVFKADPKKLKKRIIKRGQKKEFFENDDFQNKIYKNFKLVVDKIKEKQPNRILIEIDVKDLGIYDLAKKVAREFERQNLNNH